jgi:hypothetical protein
VKTIDLFDGHIVDGMPFACVQRSAIMPSEPDFAFDRGGVSGDLLLDAYEPVHNPKIRTVTDIEPGLQ